MLFIAFTSTILFTACTGPEGPPGINILGQVFETTINFNNGNDFSQVVTFPSDIEVFESDVVLVYLLSDVISGGSGGSIDVWSPLPQTFFPPQGTLLYTFDHTFIDTKILLDANFNLSLLGSEYTNDQVFRIAIVPAEFGSTDLSMRDLLVAMELNTEDIQKLD
jgi:hypothetical protein